MLECCDDTGQDGWVEAEAKGGEGYYRVDHAVVVRLGVQECYCSWQAELADNIEG